MADKTLTCTFEDCLVKHDSHGYCSNHAYQFRKYGHPLSKEEKFENLSKAAKARNEKYGSPLKGKTFKRTEEWKASRKGIRMNTGRTHFKKGQKAWNEGVSDWMTETHKESLKRANAGRPAWNKGQKVPQLEGENNWIWKGDDVSYRSLHKWVARHKGTPDTCEHCGESGLYGRKIHWSNISGDYKRDLDDWQRLCASCHGAYDSGKLTLTEIRG